MIIHFLYKNYDILHKHTIYYISINKYNNIKKIITNIFIKIV